MAKKKTPEARRADLTKAALKLFRKKGFNDTAVSDIVSEAGVAQGTFYLYFGSKDDILAEVAKEVATERCKSVEQVVNMKDVGAVKKMKMIMDALIEMGDEDKGWVFEYHEPRFRQLHDQLASKTMTAFYPLLVKVIEQGVIEGVFHSEYPAADAAFILFSGNIDNPDIMEKAGLSKKQWTEAYQEFILKLLGVID